MRTFGTNPLELLYTAELPVTIGSARPYQSVLRRRIETAVTPTNHIDKRSDSCYTPRIDKSAQAPRTGAFFM